MTKLSERIEACTGDTTELAAEMLKFVVANGAYDFWWCGINQRFRRPVALPEPWFYNNPLTDERAIAALEREYLPEEWCVDITLRPISVRIERIVNGDICFDEYVRAPTEALARSAALVRALEMSRDV